MLARGRARSGRVAACARALGVGGGAAADGDGRPEVARHWDVSTSGVRGSRWRGTGPERLTEGVERRGGGRRRWTTAVRGDVPSDKLHRRRRNPSGAFASTSRGYPKEESGMGSPERQIDGEEGWPVDLGKSSIPTETMRGGATRAQGMLRDCGQRL